MTRDDQPLAVQPCQQRGGEVDLGVDGVVVGHDRQPDLGHRTVVLDDAPLVGPVGVWRQQHHRSAAGFGGLLGPSARLGRAVRRNPRHDGEPAGGGSDGGPHHERALRGRQRLVLPQRPVGADAVAPLGREPGDVLGVPVDVDVKFAAGALAGAQRQRSGDQDAVPR